ncbi:MAG: hypothetical protein RSG77_15435 [Hafnia sp.]
MNAMFVTDHIEIDIDEISRILATEFDAELQAAKPIIPFQPLIVLKWAGTLAIDAIPVVFALWAITFLTKQDVMAMGLGIAAFLYGYNLKSLKHSNIHRSVALAAVNRLINRVRRTSQWQTTMSYLQWEWQQFKNMRRV